MNNKEQFDELLKWLDSDWEKAGERYEKIRYGLITMFSARNCSNPEELADIVFERVGKKIHDIKTNYVGKPEKYFFGVAKNVFLESLRAKETQLDEDMVKQRFTSLEPSDSELDCMKKCLNELSSEDKKTVLNYFEHSGKGKFEEHQNLAKSLDLTINALRLKIFRLKATLKKCLDKCLA